ncbi:Bifunctional FolD 2 [Gossypium arboreum]|uniref:Bifunctional FolD 2 n=1 Tax=Gossypium arboreum TaxID=29729 RepID=A0A0B0P471_GOSAR|nr:Bifunctional FolD 2 [Gossypium arboreum]
MCVADKMPRRRLRDLSIIQNPPNSEETNSEQQTTIGSSNVPNRIDEPAEIQNESGGRLKTRRRTLLKDLYELNSVERVNVARNSLAQNANLLLINYESWHHIPNSNKNQALDNFKVSDNYVKKALGKKLRAHKNALKKEYVKKNISLKEKVRNVPLGMLRYQWEDAIRFWNSKKREDCEQVGTTSRQKKIMHITGSKSFACVADDEELSSGQKVGHL